MHSVSQLKALLKEQGIRLSKKRGQNFLVDKKYPDKIINCCDITKNDSVLEIGPGLGALTEPLSLKCKKLIAVESDRKLCSFLKEHFSDYKTVEIVCADILKYDIRYTIYDIRTKLKVIGNLPYYITSPIIIYLINNRKYIEFAFITVQKEVAERLVSPPGRKSYGSLSCFVQFYTRPEILVSIPKGAFYPRPAVESALVKLKFLKKPSVEIKDESLFFKIVNAAFNKRRKTILNALHTSGIFDVNKEKLSKILSNSGIEPNRRGETLSLEEFAHLTQQFRQNETTDGHR